MTRTGQGQLEGHYPDEEPVEQADWHWDDEAAGGHPHHDETRHDEVHHDGGLAAAHAAAGAQARAEAATRREQRAQRVRRTKRRRRGRLTLLVTVVLLAAAVGGAWFGLKPVYDSFTAPDDYAGPGTGEVRVVVAPGDSGSTIGQTLVDSGVILSVKRFVEESDVDERVATIQPGTYALRQEMSVAGAIDVLADPANRIVTRVTGPEGRRASQVVDLLATRGGFAREDLEAVLKDPATLGLPEQARGVAEGWLFPATYEFEPGTTAAEALQQMVGRTTQELTELGVPQERWVAVLTEASIVQVEGGSEEDFGKVARVIANRLAVQMPLQMDSTVSYATGIFNANTTDAQRASDSPYNTYRRAGLPPGAISNPGRAAVEAVLSPTPGPWMFFVTVNLDTGETKFATTKAEHDRNVLEYQAWYRANR